MCTVVQILHHHQRQPGATLAALYGRVSCFSGRRRPPARRRRSTPPHLTSGRGILEIRCRQRVAHSMIIAREAGKHPRLNVWIVKDDAARSASPVAIFRHGYFAQIYIGCNPNDVPRVPLARPLQRVRRVFEARLVLVLVARGIAEFVGGEFVDAKSKLSAAIHSP